MTNTELKNALLSKKPVVHRHPYMGEIEYKCVYAIRYTVGDNGKIRVSAELLDKNGGAIVVARAEEVFAR